MACPVKLTGVLKNCPKYWFESWLFTHATIKTERLTINGKKAVRLYEYYYDGFPAGIVTYAATGKKETIMLMTLYSGSDTEKQVQQIQDSIRITQ